MNSKSIFLLIVFTLFISFTSSMRIRTEAVSNLLRSDLCYNRKSVCDECERRGGYSVRECCIKKQCTMCKC